MFARISVTALLLLFTPLIHGCTFAARTAEQPDLTLTPKVVASVQDATMAACGDLSPADRKAVQLGASELPKVWTRQGATVNDLKQRIDESDVKTTRMAAAGRRVVRQWDRCTNRPRDKPTTG